MCSSIETGCKGKWGSVNLYPENKGFEGNEKADELAKKMSSIDTEASVSIGLIKHQLIGYSRKQTLIEKKNIWWKTFKDAYERVFRAKVPKYYSFAALQRGELKLLTSFKTGHGRFKKHLHTMKVISDLKCKFCEKNETAEHIKAILAWEQNEVFWCTVLWSKW